MDALLGNSCVGQTIDDVCKSRFISKYYRRALAILEPLMVKCDVISAVATSMLCSILSVLHNLFLFLYFVYDII